MSDLQTYLDTFSPFVEYKMNDASGGLANSGSAGASYDLTETGTPGYQSGAASTYGATGEYYIDFDGTTDAFHNNVVSAFTSKSQGAFVCLFRSDLSHSGNLFIIKPEVGVTAQFQVQLISTDNALRFNITDGTNSQTILVGNTNWNPNTHDTTVMHMLVIQYDSTDGHQVWMDGVRLDDILSSGVVTTTTVGTGASLWWSGLSGLVDIMGVGARIEYDGAGSFSSIISPLNGRIEYIGCFASSFTHAQIKEMWDRFIGGQELATSTTNTTARYARRRARTSSVVGAPAGLDVVTFITSLDSSGSPYSVWLERCHSGWASRTQDGVGYCPRIVDTSGSDFDSSLNCFWISRPGWSIALPDQNIPSSVPNYVYRGGGRWESSNLSQITSEATFNVRFDPNSVSATGTGREEVAVQLLATTYTYGPIAAYYWNYLTGSNGAFDRLTTWLDTVPTRYPVGAVPHALEWNSDSSYMAYVSTSGAGDNVSTGGGGVHIYAISGAGSSYAGTRQTLSGYTPTAVSIRGCAHFNDGTSDYLIVHAQSASSMGITGEQDTIGVFKRSGSTWTATSNLINNGTSVMPTGGTYCRALWVVDQDLYLGFWNGTSGTGMTVFFKHLRWNGTYFEEQTAPPWPPYDQDTTASAPNAFAVTDDQKGMFIQTGSLAGGAGTIGPSNWLAFDRDTDTGALTWRSTFWDNLVGSADVASMGPIGYTELDWPSYPDGRDGQ